MTSPGTARIVILGRPLAPSAMALAAEAGAQVVASDTYLRGAGLEAFIAEHQPRGVIVRLGEMTACAMDAAPGLRVIAKHGVGYDTIDLAAANERGITVSIAAGANAISVAEHGFALILGVARRISYLDSRIRAGHWDKPHFLGTELYGKTLGVVGFGAIGRHLARIASGFGMRLLKYDPADMQASELGEEPVALARLIAESDVVSLNCPLTDATRNMVGADQFAAMKDGAILINTARGGLIDLQALTAALQEGRIGGAGLDTFPVEPPELSTRLTALDNLVVSPHIGASTIEAGERVGMLAMSQVLDGIAGRAIEPRFVVSATLQPPLAQAKT